MKYITLSNGVKMDMLGYGVYQVSKEECERCVLDALTVGYRSIDTAQSYFNEEEVGSAIKKSGIDRSVACWTEVKNKEFYYIVTAADSEKESAETTLACFRGYADCVEGAKEMGVIYGMGAYEKGEIKNSNAMTVAYEMGKNV